MDSKDTWQTLTFNLKHMASRKNSITMCVKQMNYKGSHWKTIPWFLARFQTELSNTQFFSLMKQKLLLQHAVLFSSDSCWNRGAIIHRFWRAFFSFILPYWRKNKISIRSMKRQFPNLAASKSLTIPSE